MASEPRAKEYRARADECEGEADQAGDSDPIAAKQFRTAAAIWRKVAEEMERYS